MYIRVIERGGFLKINIIVPDDLLHEIDKAAKNLGISRTAYMNMASARQLQQDYISIAFPNYDAFVRAYRQWDEELKEGETGKTK